MPTFSDSVYDGKEYRKKVYMYDEILEIIKKYGMPQDWNDDGKYGPERYIEAHIWSDKVIQKYPNPDSYLLAVYSAVCFHETGFPRVLLFDWEHMLWYDYL